MSRLWKHRPSPAMIVAMLALFVAMGGTGYAVSKLPKRSVGPAQLRRNAVRAEHIKAGSITTAKLAKSTLSSLRSPVAAPTVAGTGTQRSRRRRRARAGPRRLRRQGRASRTGRSSRTGRRWLTAQGRRATGRRAAAANTAAVADHAKLADNASQAGRQVAWPSS